MLSLQKAQFFSLFSLPDFSFEIRKSHGTCLEKGDNSLRQRGVVTCKTNRDKGRRGESKIGSFEQMYFLDDP